MRKIKPNIHLESPKVQTVSNFLQDDLCDFLISNYDQNLENSKVMGSEEEIVSSSRTASVRFISSKSQTIKPIVSKVAKYFNWNLSRVENVQFAKYEVGQMYEPHYDAFDIKYLEKIGKSQRLATSIIYLNDNFIGGETSFPKLDLNIRPSKGMLLFFKNCINETNQLNPFMLHSSNKITKGTKYILTIWLCS